MKKLLFAVVAMAIVFSFTSCKKSETSFAGTYVGTYTFFKYNDATQTNEQDGAVQNGKKVPVVQLTDSRVRLYGILPLDKVSEGRFESSQISVDLAKSLLVMVGVSQEMAERVTDMKFSADFTSANHMNFTMSYELEILNGLSTVEIHILKFSGDRQ